jgi:hypothetical protein
MTKQIISQIDQSIYKAFVSYCQQQNLSPEEMISKFVYSIAQTNTKKTDLKKFFGVLPQETADQIEKQITLNKKKQKVKSKTRESKLDKLWL